MQQCGTVIEADEASTSNSVEPTVQESIRNHPLMPILELLCEKCGDAMSTMQPSAFKMNDVAKLFERLESRGVSANTGDEKLDKFMRDAVIALRTHLIELQKVSSLADDFYSKYLQALRRRMSHEVLVGVSGDSDDDLTDPNSTDELLSSSIEQGTVAILTTPQGTVSISLSPHTTLVCKPELSSSEEMT